MKKIFVAALVISALATPARSIYAEESGDVKLERIVVTPTRMTQRDYKVTSNVSVIDSERIASSNARYVADILKEELGIHYFDNSTDKTATVDIRGFGDTAGRNILLLVDGRKVNPVDLSGPDWIQIPIEAVERIEVLRGAGSVLYGDNAVGGVVNIITKKGEGLLSGRAGISLGSYDSRKEDAEISGSHDRLSYYLYSKYHETDGYRSNSDVLTKDLNARLDYELSEGLLVNLATGWHEDDYGMPGGLDDQGELTQYGRRGSADYMDFASTKDRYVRLSTEIRPWFDVTDSASLNLDVFYRNRDAYFWFYYGGYPSPSKYMIDTTGATIRYTYEGDIADYELNFVLGADYYDTEHIIKGSEWNTDAITIYKEEKGVYGYLEHEMFKNIVMDFGARYQEAKYRFDQRSPSVSYETRNPSETVLMGGTKYEYADGSNLHFKVQETFRFLATDEWYGTALPPAYTSGGVRTNLKHQAGIQYEVGIRHNFGDVLLFTATPYLINMKDEIYVDPYPSPAHNENYPKTRRKGIELGLNLDLSRFVNLSYLDRADFYTNYTFQEAKFKDGDYGSNDIPMTPRHQATAGLNLNIRKNYALSFTGKYVDERYAINDTRNETPKMKDYFVADGKVSYSDGSLEIFAGINNIFDEKYFTYAAKSSTSNKKDYYPSPERNFEIGTSYRF